MAERVEDALELSSDMSDENDDDVMTEEMDPDDPDDLASIGLVTESPSNTPRPRSRLGPTVPRLPLPGACANNRALVGMESKDYRGLARIDLLSEAFCFNQEILQQKMTERGTAMQEVVAAAFERALGVPSQQLKFYHVTEITPSPHMMNGNNHMAVAIQSSDFSLNALEGLIEDRNKKETECRSYKRKFSDSEERVRILENQVNDLTGKLAAMERDYRRLENELRLRQAYTPQRSPRSSQLPAVVASPRLIATGGASQASLPASLLHLQRVVAENSQHTQAISECLQMFNSSLG